MDSPDELIISIECAVCGMRFVPSGAAISSVADEVIDSSPAGQIVPFNPNFIQPSAPAPSAPPSPRPDGNRPHSSLGIASFIIALLIGGMDAVMAVILSLTIAHHPRGETLMDLTAKSTGAAMSFYCMNFASIPLCLIGLGLAVTGMISQKGKNQLFSIIGLIGNGVVILAVVGIYAVAVATTNGR